MYGLLIHILYVLLETERDDDDCLNAGAVAGISIGATVVGGVCGAGGVHLCHKIKSKKSTYPMHVCTYVCLYLAAYLNIFLFCFCYTYIHAYVATTNESC